MVYAEVNHLLEQPPLTDSALLFWTAQAVFLAVSGAMVTLTQRRINGVLRRMRQELSERTRAEEALRASEERYRAFVTLSPDGIYRNEFDPPIETFLPIDEQVRQALSNGRIAECNDAFAAMYGYSTAEELIGARRESLTLADNPQVSDTNRQFVRDGYRVTNAQFSVVDQMGNRRSFAVSSNGVVENQKLVRTWNVMRDITERKRAEEALRDSEARFRALIENLDDVIFVLDAEGVIRYASPSALPVLGFKSEQLLGQKIFERIHPDDLARIRAGWQALAENTEALGTIEARVKHADGSWHIHEGVGRNLFNDPAVRGFVLNSRDITERKQAEEAEQRSNEYFSKIFLASPVSISLSNLADGRFLDVNPSFLNLFGFAYDEVIGHTALEIGTWANPNDRAEFVRAMRENRSVRNFPTRYRTKTREIRETLTSAEIIRIDDKELLLGLVHDITALAQKEEALARAHRELAEAYDATILGWARMMDLRDRDTVNHTLRVTEMTLRLARAMGVSEAELLHIRRGALLHDMGKMAIPDQILLKPGPLTDEEWTVMRRHPVYAYEMLSPITYLRQALDLPYNHHERWDGRGYPRGLKGEQIPLSARLFAVIDVWDALTSDRPYRKRWEKGQVLEYIRENSGAYFDPRIVAVFMQIIEQEPGAYTPMAS